MNFAQTLLDCRAADSKTALFTQQGQVSYGQLRAAARCTAQFLKRKGLQPGERVLLAAESSLFWVQSYLGIALAGGVSIPVAVPSTAESIAGTVSATEPRMACVEAKWLRRLDNGLSACRCILSDARPPHLNVPFDLTTTDQLTENSNSSVHAAEIDELAVIMFTSGSTGAPRGVMVSHGNILANSEDIIASLEISANDRIMAVLPFHYCFGTSLLHTHLMAAASLVVDNRFLYPEKVLQNIQQTQCTSFAGVPSTYQILLRRSNLKKMEFPYLRKLQQAGGRLAESFITELEAALPQARLFVMYGQTEATARLSCITPEQRRDHPGSIGRGLPQVHLQVISSDGEPAAVGQTGQLVATGKNITLGYWQDSESTRRVFAGALHTGDLATVDEDGFIRIVGRTRDILKCGGKRVSAHSIEETLLAFPGMADAAVLSIADDVLGEAVCLFVVHPQGEKIENEFRKFCEQELERTLLPKKIFFVDNLPRSNSGKVDKLALKATLAAQGIQ